MNLVSVARHDLVFKECATSMCTTLVVRQGKRQNHHFKATLLEVHFDGSEVVESCMVERENMFINQSRG